MVTPCLAETFVSSLSRPRQRHNVVVKTDSLRTDSSPLSGNLYYCLSRALFLSARLLPWFQGPMIDLAAADTTVPPVGYCECSHALLERNSLSITYYSLQGPSVTTVSLIGGPTDGPDDDFFSSNLALCCCRELSPPGGLPVGRPSSRHASTRFSALCLSLFLGSGLRRS